MMTVPARACLVDDPATGFSPGSSGATGAGRRYAPGGRLRRARPLRRPHPRRVHPRAGYLGEGRTSRPRASDSAPAMSPARSTRRARPSRGPGARRAGRRGSRPRPRDATAEQRRAESRARWSRRRRDSASRSSRRACSTAAGRSGRSRPCRPPGVAPSGANRQPWHFPPGRRRAHDGARGQARLGPRPSTSASRACTVELGAQHEGVEGARGRRSPSPTSPASPPRADPPESRRQRCRAARPMLAPDQHHPGVRRKVLLYSCNVRLEGV